MNVVAKKIYIKKFEQVIFHLHQATATWVETVPVHETFKGQTVWQGDVEVFDLTGQPKAKRASAWSYNDEKEEKYTAVLEIPPVESALTAVRVSIVAESKGKK